MMTGSTSYSFEIRNDWQRAWAEFRTVQTPIDYVRTSGRGIDPLLLNFAPDPAARAAAGGGCCSINMARPTSSIAEVDLRRLFPGGPARGIFTARFGPDGTFLGRFMLRAANSGAIRTMLDEGVRRMDMALPPGARRRAAAARSQPRHHRARRCSRRSRRRPRSRWRATPWPPRKSRPRPPRRSRASASRSRRRMPPRCRRAEVSAEPGRAASPRRSPPASRSAAPR